MLQANGHDLQLADFFRRDIEKAAATAAAAT
jgi:hypothetical protein